MTTRAFVDAIEAGQARLVLGSGKKAFTVPRALLPREAREGSWVEISIELIEPPESDAEELRKKLARDDDGGDLKL